MELNFSSMGFLVGILVGLICIGGLSWGFKILIESQQDTTLSPRGRKLKGLMAVAILIGQLFLAMGLLFKTPWVRSSPLGVAVGIILSILLSSALMNYLNGPK